MVGTSDFLRDHPRSTDSGSWFAAFLRIFESIERFPCGSILFIGVETFVTGDVQQDFRSM